MPSKRSLNRLRKRYEEIYRSLSRAELQRGRSALDEVELTELFDAPDDLWLGFYTRQGIETALEQYGILDDIRRRGFKKLDLELDLDDPDDHMLRIWSRLPRCPEPLLELVVSRGVLHVDDEIGEAIDREFIPVLTVHWALMQNPLATFNPSRPPLPGQRYPGLGIGLQILAILAKLARRLNLSGLMTVPAHFHNAAMYGAVFHYLSSRTEGLFRALRRDLGAQLGDSVARASWAVHWHTLRHDSDGARGPFEWFHEPMIWPVDEAFNSFFNSAAYRTTVDRTAAHHRFEVRTDELDDRLAEYGLAPWDKARVDSWLANVTPIPPSTDQ